MPPEAKKSLRDMMDDVDVAYGRKPPSTTGRASTSMKALTEYNPEQSTLGYLANEAKMVPAGLLGMLPDLAYNIRDLLKGSAGGLYTGATGQPAPEVLNLDPGPDTSLWSGRPGGAGTYAKAMGYEHLRPAGPVQEAAGKVQNAVLNMALFKKIPGAGLENLTWGQAGGIGVGSGLGAYAGKKAFPDQPLAEVAGAVVGGALPALAHLSPTVQLTKKIVQSLRSPEKREEMARQAKPFIEDIVKKRVQNDLASELAGTPGAVATTEQSLQMAKGVPGAKLDLGQASQVPSIIDQVKTAATESGLSKNEKLAADAVNRQALRAVLGKGKPTEEIGGIVGKTVGSAEARQRAVDAALQETKQSRTTLSTALPSTDTLKSLGKQAKSLRTVEKAKADVVVKTLLDNAEVSATGKTFDVGNVVKTADDVLKQPIFTYAPERTPKIASRLEALRGPAEEAPVLYNAQGKVIPGPATEGTVKPVDFTELRAMREAVNEDLRDASVPGNTLARQQRRELTRIKDAIDETITAQGGVTAKTYKKFVDFYRDDYAPRFLRGPNIKQSLKDATGSERVADEALFTQYFRRNSPTSAQAYLELYGKNPDAKLLMRDAIIDRYRQEAVDAQGNLTDASHARFMKNYEAPLRILKEGGIAVGDELSTMGRASDAITSRAASLKAEQEMLAQDKFLKVASDQFGAKTADQVMKAVVQDPRQADLLVSRLGTDGARGMLSWMADDFSNIVSQSDVGSFGSNLSAKLQDKAYMQAYRKAFEQAYGKDITNQQVSGLKQLATLAKRMEATEIESTAGVQHIGQLSKSPILDKLGFTAGTVVSLVRSIITGRSSEYSMATILGGQYGIKEVTRIRNAVISESLKNPEAMQRILTIAKSGPQDTGAMAAAKALGRDLWMGLKDNLKAIPRQTKDAVPAIVGTLESNEVDREIKE